MATTPNVGIVYPVVGNTITPLATHFANLANSVDTAMVAERDKSGRLIGTDAARIALTGAVKREGLLWYSTDTNREWEYDGVNWVTADAGMYLVWPTSVVGGTAQADGSVLATSGATSVSFNNVFTSRFKNYLLIFHVVCSTGGHSTNLRLRRAGADLSSSSYQWQTTYSANAQAQAIGNPGSSFPISYPGPASTAGEVRFFTPFYTTQPKGLVSHSGMTSGAGFGITQSAGGVADALAYDGFTIYPATGAWSATSVFNIYGLA